MRWDCRKHLIVGHHDQVLWMRARHAGEFFKEVAWGDEWVEDVEEWFACNRWMIDDIEEKIRLQGKGKGKGKGKKRALFDDDGPKGYEADEGPKGDKAHEGGKGEDDDDDIWTLLGDNDDGDGKGVDDGDGKGVYDGDGPRKRARGDRGDPRRPGRRGMRSIAAVLDRANDGHVGPARERERLMIANSMQFQAQATLSFVERAWH